MTSTDPERIAVVGTGLIGTSIAMASSRVGCDVVGWDPDPASLALAAERGPVRSALSTIVVACRSVRLMKVLSERGVPAMSG